MARKTPAEITAWEAVYGLRAGWGPESNRANILVTDPEGREPLHAYATGIRNPVGLAIHPTTSNLWVLDKVSLVNGSRSPGLKGERNVNLSEGS